MNYRDGVSGRPRTAGIGRSQKLPAHPSDFQIPAVRRDAENAQRRPPLSFSQTSSRLARDTGLAQSPLVYPDMLRLIASLSNRRPSDRLPTRLDMLFDRLAHGEGEATAIEEAIWTVWMYHPHSRAAEALNRAVSDIAAQRYDIAETRLGMLLRARPDFAEAWHKRATLHYIREEDAESVLDLHRTLQLEPRHFPALLSFGEICLSNREREGAELAFHRALRIHPRLDAARKGLERATALDA